MQRLCASHQKSSYTILALGTTFVRKHNHHCFQISSIRRGMSAVSGQEYDKNKCFNGNPLLISIEGNIGSGKSTFLEKLRSVNPKWVFIEEPVDLWTRLRDEKGQSLLQLFYDDRRRWSYTFQNCALLTRFQNIESTIARFYRDARPDGTPTACQHQRQVFVTERCLDTDYQVFTKMLYKEGSIDKLEFELYRRWLAHLRLTATPLSAMVYLDVAPDVCAARIQQRGREGEAVIPLDYLKALDKQQQEWVAQAGIPCLRTTTEGLTAAQQFIEQL